MRLFFGQRMQIMLQAFDFLLVFIRIKRAAKQAGSANTSISVGRIGFTIIADVFQIAGVISIHTLLPSMPSLPGKPHSLAMSSNGTLARGW